MKKIHRIIFMFFLLSSMISCKDDQQTVLPESHGKVNHILLIMKDKPWKGTLGDTIRKYFTTEFPDLPQSEPLFTINQASPDLFTGSFKKMKTILLVKLGSENRIQYLKNRFAAPQLIVKIEGKDINALKNLISKHANEIIDRIYNFEIELLQKKHRESLRNNQDIEKELGINIEIPDFFVLVDHQKGFFWFRRDIKNGEQDIILYEVPLAKDSIEQRNMVMHYRDSIGKRYIPGAIDSSYMKTVKGISPSQNYLTIHQLKAIETRGLWDMKNDFMGGPYLNYTLIDKKHNRAIVGEGFVYAPALNKRDYMVQLEAILKTMKLKK